MGEILKIRGLEVTYQTPEGGVKAVDGVDLVLRKGEAMGLVGESGCGKSTLGKSLLGILPPDTEITGEILLNGNELNPKNYDLRISNSEYRISKERIRKLRGEEIALIFQDPMTRLNPLMRIEDHFIELLLSHSKSNGRTLGFAPTKMTKEEAREKGLKELERMGIPRRRAKHYPHEFSGGMRQRIMIALTTVLKPKLLVADEPTTSLDVIVEAQIIEILKELKSLGMTLLLVTHNLALVAESCDRVSVMYGGKIVEKAPTLEIFENPLHPYTQGLLQSTIHLGTTSLNSIAGSPPDLHNPPSGCRFHPRCTFRKEICDKEDPQARQPSEGRDVKCVLY
jgi:oligopeptide/dipeptide ABC transporter ATP-binding protein